MKKSGKFVVSMLLVWTMGVTHSTVWAQSINHLTKVVTVGHNEILGENDNEVEAPKLRIELKDGLAEGDRFYLNLEDARWTKEELVIFQQEKKDEQDAVKVIGQSLTPTQLEVKVVEGNLAPYTVLDIPLYVQVEGEEAKVNIDSNNTTVSAETFTFAHISSKKGTVTATEEVEKVTQAGKLPKMIIEEAYAGQFRNGLEKGMKNTIILRLDHTDFVFELTSESKLVGVKGFEGISTSESHLKLLNDQQLQIILPESLTQVPKHHKGGFILEGVQVKSKVLQPQAKIVFVNITGDLVEASRVKALEIGEYKVSLDLENEQSVLAGTTQNIAFTLREDMKNSLLKERTLMITVSKGVQVVEKDGQVEVIIEGQPYYYDALIEEGKCTGFKINGIEQASLKEQQDLNFQFKVNVPAQFTGKVNLHIEGSAMPNTIDATILEVKATLEVEVEPFQAKSGIKNQVGGSIMLKEKQQATLTQGQSLFIGLDTSMIKLEDLPFIDVTEGDLVLGEAKLVNGGIQIPIVSSSTVPSTIVMKHFDITLDGTVPKGRFEVAIGGPALSTCSSKELEGNSDFEYIDPVVIEDFILVDVGPKNRKEITFKIGEEAYAVNGKYYHLDVPAYIEEGRVMVPIKYVAEALGIGSNQVKYDSATKTLTVYGDKVIELQVGSNIMYVDHEKIIMQTSTKLVKGYTMVPIGEVARALELSVEWNSKLETATFVGYYE